MIVKTWSVLINKPARNVLPWELYDNREELIPALLYTSQIKTMISDSAANGIDTAKSDDR